MRGFVVVWAGENMTERVMKNEPAKVQITPTNSKKTMRRKTEHARFIRAVGVRAAASSTGSARRGEGVG